MCTRHVRCSGLSALLTVLVAALCSGTAGAQVLYVDDDAPLGGDGLSWDTPFSYLQDALYTAAGDPGVAEVVEVVLGEPVEVRAVEILQLEPEP